MNLSGDGYVTCSQGCIHWGRYGAAGLLLFSRGEDGQVRYLLQKRSPHVHNGSCWSTPGGALNHSEHPVQGAWREAAEELGFSDGAAADVSHVATLVDDHGGWVYYTIIMKSGRLLMPDRAADEDCSWESDGFSWLTAEELLKLPLHPGFAASFREARFAVERSMGS